MSGHAKMRLHVDSVWRDSHASKANCKQAEIALETDLSGNGQAFNPAELLLAAVTACVIKSNVPGTDLQGVLTRKGAYA
jgi:uncharacterized OsmC-like protein